MSTIEYKCEMCRYETSKKSSYLNHLKSKKHLNKVNGDNMSDTSDTSDITEATEYCTLQSLTLSRKPKPTTKLTPDRLPPQPTSTNDSFQIQFILQELNLLKSQNLINQTEISNLKSQNALHQSEISNLKSQVSSFETKILIMNNNEIQAIKTTQQIHSITPNYQPMYSIPPNIQQTNNRTPNIQQIENIKAVSVPSKKIISNNQTDNTFISNPEVKETVKKPVKPTLTEYLNTVCSDAGDYEDFCLRNPEVDINKIVSDLKDIPNDQEALTNYVMMTLKHTPIEKIPFRCIDVHNKKTIIKVKGKWYNASDECRDKFIDMAKARLNDHLLKKVLDETEKQDELIKKTAERINQYEDLKYTMEGEPEEKQFKLMEQFEGFENFDLKANKVLVKQMDNQSNDLTVFAARFPNVKKSYMEILSKEVLKYIKIDMRNIELEDLPLFFPEVKKAIPEPKITNTPITYNKREEVEREPLHIIFSRILNDEYSYKNQFDPRNPDYILKDDILRTFVEEEILDAFGLGKGDKMKNIFKTMMTKEDIEDVMKFFDTVEEISKIFADGKIRTKIPPISEVIETLLSNCCLLGT